jgi:hypothetical protein
MIGIPTNYHHYQLRFGGPLIRSKRPRLEGDDWIYCGRKHPDFPELPFGSPLQNPWHRFDPGCLRKYNDHLEIHVASGKGPVFDALMAITPTTRLVCFCVRKDGSGDCHTKLIAKWAGIVQGQAPVAPLI